KRTRTKPVSKVLEQSLHSEEPVEEGDETGGDEGAYGDAAEHRDADDRPGDEAYHHLGFHGEEFDAARPEIRSDGADGEGDEAGRRGERLQHGGKAQAPRGEGGEEPDGEQQRPRGDGEAIDGV